MMMMMMMVMLYLSAVTSEMLSGHACRNNCLECCADAHPGDDQIRANIRCVRRCFRRELQDRTPDPNPSRHGCELDAIGCSVCCARLLFGGQLADMPFTECHIDCVHRKRSKHQQGSFIMTTERGYTDHTHL